MTEDIEFIFGLSVLSLKLMLSQRLSLILFGFVALFVLAVRVGVTLCVVLMVM
jgi:hypothetical protein